MDSAKVAELMAKMGVTGIDPSKVALAMTLLQELGGEVRVDPEELESYYPQVESDFYVPTKIPKNFYYDAEGLRRASKVGDMRSLTAVDPGVFRRLLGIK